MSERMAAGLAWRQEGDVWHAEDRRGRFQLIAYQPDTWMAVWFPVEEGCGCGRGPAGGGDYDTFEAAAEAIARLADG